MSFTAKYPGRCAGEDCDGIKEGDEVSYVDDELMHTDCEASETRRHSTPERPPCTECFLIHPEGACDA